MAVPAPSRRQQEFQAYMLAARQRLLRHEVATAQQVRELYRRVAEQLRRELERIPGDTLQRRHLEALRAAIERRAEELRDELLRLSVTGIRVGAGLATEAAQEYLLDVTRGILRAAGIRALFASVHEQAVLALLSRTLHDGLRLSDRIWRLADGVKGAITAVVEEAVAQGMDPRRAARLLHQYLRPGGYWARPLRDETRRRMRVPRNVLHGALRLTVTELHHAFHEAANAAYHATPGVYAVEWRLSNAHVVPDVCDELARRGPYTPGIVPPKPHPWCRCFTVPVAEPPEQFVERLRAWANDPASQPDIELWYRRYSEYLGGAVRAARAASRPAAAAAAVAGPERFWQDQAYRMNLLARLDAALGTGDQAAAEEIIRAIDEAVQDMLRREGLPRAQTTVSIKGPDEEPSLREAAGFHRWKCPIVLNRKVLRHAVAQRSVDGMEFFVHTWVHESLHARVGQAGWDVKSVYSDAPGYEESVVEFLARRLMERHAGWKTPQQPQWLHAYNPYVAALQGLADALGQDAEQLARRLWARPDKRVDEELLNVVEEFIGYKLSEAHPSALGEMLNAMREAFDRKRLDEYQQGDWQARNSYSNPRYWTVRFSAALGRLISLKPGR